jgi:hypothetical protein
VLLFAYLIALFMVVRRLISLSFSHPSVRLRQWGAAIIMLSAGPIAFMFSYTPFHGQMGMQFWLLVGAFEGLAQGEDEAVSFVYEESAYRSLNGESTDPTDFSRHLDRSEQNGH